MFFWRRSFIPKNKLSSKLPLSYVVVEVDLMLSDQSSGQAALLD